MKELSINAMEYKLDTILDDELAKLIDSTTVDVSTILESLKGMENEDDVKSVLDIAYDYHLKRFS